MLDPRRVGAASPEAARRRSPLGQISFERPERRERFERPERFERSERPERFERL